MDTLRYSPIRHQYVDNIDTQRSRSPQAVYQKEKVKRNHRVGDFNEFLNEIKMHMNKGLSESGDPGSARACHNEN